MADMAGMIKLGVDQVNRIYPLAGMYTAGIVGGNIGGDCRISCGIARGFPAVFRFGAVEICEYQQRPAFPCCKKELPDAGTKKELSS